MPSSNIEISSSRYYLVLKNGISCSRPSLQIKWKNVACEKCQYNARIVANKRACKSRLYLFADPLSVAGTYRKRNEVDAQ